MSYIVTKTEIPGTLIIDSDSFDDSRGSLWTLYEEGSIEVPRFIQDKVSVSNPKVIRGLHGDPDTGKLITCFAGECFLAVVDARKESETFMKHFTVTLRSCDRKSVYVPPGCLNGHAVISQDPCVFFYKWTHRYTGPSSQYTVHYGDPDLSIKWPIESPIISDRDKKASTFKEVLCR